MWCLGEGASFENIHSGSLIHIRIHLQLNAIPCGSNVLRPTSFILRDISEKIVAATALRALQTKMSKIVDEAIEVTVARWDEKPMGSLTSHDLFYVKLCKFQCIFEVLVDMTDDRVANQSRTTVAIAQFISDVNTVVLGTLSQVLMYREQNANTFKLQTETYENQPWTAMPGGSGIHDALIRLIDVSVRYGAQCVAESELKHVLFHQLLELMDMVLDGRKNYLDSVRDTEKFQVLQQQFEAQRFDLISVLSKWKYNRIEEYLLIVFPKLVRNKQYECAAKLAEKYLDFQSLVLICDETEDKDRLDEYTRKYEEFDFSQYAINWHLRQNRHAEVFERFKGNQTALAQFMRDHPSLGWIQLMFNGDFDRAAKVLFDLAQCETEFVARKKSMLSLAKLASLTVSSDLSAHVEKINQELTVIEYQSHLGHDVLQNFGFDATDQRVLKPDEIINVCMNRGLC